MKAAFYTLGCKVNQYETQSMLEQLKSAGYSIVSCEEKADVYIINSCTVTASSDQKTRQTVRHYKRLHPSAAVVLTGCMPQAYPDAAKELEEADIVLGNNNHAYLTQALSDFWMTKQRICRINQHETGEVFRSIGISDFEERTRAFVKIEDGCDRFCSYCIIPVARGRVRSRELKDLKEELELLVSRGYQEAVLVGINLSAYGRDNGASFCDAVALSCAVKGIQRVRLGSLEPDHITPEVISSLSKLDKLCPQFHISLQSGCDATLKRMNRHYDTEEYAQLCENLRSAFPNIALTTDVMVGFPGETREEFETSLAFVKRIGFSKIHVFPYSPREGTRAAKMENQVTKAEKKERCREMIAAGQELRSAFLQKQINGIFPVLFETACTDNIYEGYTPNYTPVRVHSEKNICGLLKNVLINRTGEDWCEGMLLDCSRK